MGRALDARPQTCSVIGEFNINSLQATAGVEETQAPFSPGGLDTHERARFGPGELDIRERTPIRLAPSTAPTASVLLRACRPRQWSKNLLVLAAPCAAGVIDRPQVAAQVAGAFLVLCMVSSATYLVNDVRDREQDRRHPRKRRAAGGRRRDVIRALRCGSRPRWRSSASPARPRSPPVSARSPAAISR